MSFSPIPEYSIKGRGRGRGARFYKAHRLPVIATGLRDENGHRPRTFLPRDISLLRRDNLSIKNEGFSLTASKWTLTQIKVHLQNLKFAYRLGAISRKDYLLWRSNAIRVRGQHRGNESSGAFEPDASPSKKAGVIENCGLRLGLGSIKPQGLFHKAAEAVYPTRERGEPAKTTLPWLLAHERASTGGSGVATDLPTAVGW